MTDPCSLLAFACLGIKTWKFDVYTQCERVSPATQAQWIFIRLLGPCYDLVIYVCEVTHVLYSIPKVLQVAVQNIKGDVNPSMSYVSPATQKHINATLLGISQTCERCVL